MAQWPGHATAERSLPPAFSSLMARAGHVVSSSSLSLARIAGAVAGFATQVALARTLKADALGVFFSVTSLAAVVGLVAAHGYPAIAPRFISRYLEHKKPALVAGFIGQAKRNAALYVIVATLAILTAAALLPGLDLEWRIALAAAALSIPANAALRINGALALAIRRFALAYLPDTCFRSFLLLAGVLALIGLGVTLTSGNVTCLLALVVTGLAIAQYGLLAKDLPRGPAPAVPPRLVRLWRREAKPLILVALFTSFFADVAILIFTPLLSSADTATIGLCLKLALLVGFGVQIAHQIVTPDLAEAKARKNKDAIRAAALRALAFPLAITLAAFVIVVLWGEQVLAIFGPEFTDAKLALVILMGCQVVRAMFGPNVALLTVMGAQRENAWLALTALIVLAVSAALLAPLYGVLGAAIAVVISTLFWLAASAVVLARVGGPRTDALYLFSKVAAFRSA